MAYRIKGDGLAQGEAGHDNVPNRLFTSSCSGEVKEWDPTNGTFQQMTIITVRTIYGVVCLISTLSNFILHIYKENKIISIIIIETECITKGCVVRL